jgi:hypothetical protein
MAIALDPAPQQQPPRIDLLSDMDVAYWCRALDVDHTELRRAVQHVGPRADAVARYLARQRDAGARTQ